ncbi:MAG: LEA type 2 family protein [Polyangiaceae bacterium]
MTGSVAARCVKVLALVLCLSAVACIENPRVRLHHADVQGASLSGAMLDVVLEIQNPNSADIKLRDLTAETTFAGKYKLPPIVLHPDLWLPANQTTQVHVPTVLPWLMIPHILAETMTAPRVTFVVTGSANVTATSTFGIEQDNVPIHLEGEMPRQIMVNLSTGKISF